MSLITEELEQQDTEVTHENIAICTVFVTEGAVGRLEFRNYA